MRDLIERHDAYGREMLADLTGREGPAKAPGSAVGGDLGGKASQVHAGASEGAGRALCGRHEAQAREDGAMLQQLLQAQIDRVEADRLWDGDGVSADRIDEAQARLDRLTAAVLDRMAASHLRSHTPRVHEEP